MEDSCTNKPKPAALKTQHEKIGQLYTSSKDLKQNEADLQDLGRILNKMYGKHEKHNIESTVDHMFKIAQEKMESDHDKKVLVGLRQMVRELEHNLYRPQPRYQDAFFFPNMQNIKRLQKYIQMAKKSIDLAIFSFTNDTAACRRI